uniref:Phosphate transporter n=1 Tax=Phallusia mammillata TaxID=59560 RepID=A0A6F9DSZ4_9ASCI|nr:sodium-dependent phosphate transporter 1-like [Phallusia mammillata]
MDVTTGSITSSASLSTFADWTTATAWSLESVLWMLIVGFVIAFILSFAVGANDVANSFGTTVGANVLTLRQACILATIFETAGAVLIGAKVGETIRKGIIDVNVYKTEEGPRLLMLGNISAMFGSGLWQLIATALKLPVSGTHSIVGASIGFSLVAVGPLGVNWYNLGFIVASWFISPVLTGFAAVFLFYVVERFCLDSDDPLKNGLRLMPLFYAVAVGVNIFSFLYSGAPLLGFDNLPLWGTLLIALASMIVIAVLTRFVAVPRMRINGETVRLAQDAAREDVGSSGKDFAMTTCDEKKKEHAPLMVEYKSTSTDLQNTQDTTDGKEKASSSSRLTDVARSSSSRDDDVIGDKSSKHKTSSTLPPIEPFESDNEESSSLDTQDPEDQDKAEAEEDEDPPEVRQIFSSLQILTACFASFAHGGNDVCNAIGPLIALWLVFWSGEVRQQSFTPWYLLLYGGVGVSVGLWVMGRRVINTIGKDLTKVTPSRGFCIEVMTAITVLVASNIGIPVSTTHCKVGAVVSIGWYRSRAAVDWSIVRNIAFAWFVTVPVSGLFSAGAMFFLVKVT